jgi:hypothetical protein
MAGTRPAKTKLGRDFLPSSLRDFPRTALRNAGEGLSEGTPWALRERAAIR